MSRRPSGEGQIGQWPNGTWFASFQLAGKRRSIYGKSRSEVAERLRELQVDARSGRLVNSSKLTIGEFPSEWLESSRTRPRPSTMVELPRFGGRAIAWAG